MMSSFEVEVFAQAYGLDGAQRQLLTEVSLGGSSAVPSPEWIRVRGNVWWTLPDELKATVPIVHEGIVLSPHLFQ